MSPLRRILTALHTALGRCLADPPAAKRKARCSYFGIEPGTLQPPKSDEDLEAAAWDRAHFNINGRPLP